MTVQTTAKRADYFGNSVGQDYVVPFYFLENSHLQVLLTDTTTSIVTTLASGVDYTVTGAGDAAGGEIHTAAVYTASQKITILRNMPFTQLTSYPENGPFPAKSHENALDIHTMGLQQLAEGLDRSLKLPPESSTVAPELPAPEAGTILGWNGTATGLVNFPPVSGSAAALQADLANPSTPGKGANMVAFTASLTGASARTIQDKAEDQRSFRDFDAVGDGTADDTAALLAAMSVVRGRITGRPGDVYKITSSMLMTGNVDIDLCGATIKPVGAINCFNSMLGSPANTTTIPLAVTAGTRTVAVAAATGISAGKWVELRDDANIYTAFYARVEGVSGLNVTLERPIPWAYLAGVTVNVYPDSQWKGSFRMANGFFDASAITGSGVLGSCLRVAGFRSALVDNIEILNNTTDSTNEPVMILQCLDAEIRSPKSRGHVTRSQSFSMAYCRMARIVGGDIDGSGFGAGLSYCETALASGAKLVGRKQQEVDNSVSPAKSVRGIKFQGCYTAEADGCDVSGYDSPIKFEDNVWGKVVGGHIHDSARGAAFSGYGINSSGNAATPHTLGLTVIGARIENCGYGISHAHASDLIVEGTLIRNVDFNGIITAAGGKLIGHGNKIENWGLSGATEAIYTDSNCLSHTLTGNRFRNTAQTYPCIRGFFAASGSYAHSDNTCETGNPLYGGTIGYFQGSISGTTLTLVTNTSGNALSLGQCIHGAGLLPGTQVLTLLSGVQGANGSTYSLSRDCGTVAEQPMSNALAGVEMSGTATIPSGSTSAVVKHGLVYIASRPPRTDEIDLTPGNGPTTDPGHVWISGISGTQFTINCKVNPGASGAIFGWGAAYKQPFNT